MKTFVLSIVALAAMVVVAAAAGPPVIGLGNRHFDHARHDSSSAAGGKPAACNACHTVDAQGAFKLGREHARCAACHQYPASCTVMQTAGVKGPARVCQVCHIATRPECLPKDLPAIPKADSFEAQFTHNKHLTLGGSIEKDCAQCHTAQAAKPVPLVLGAAHKLCSGCHNANGVKPAITECAGCHTAPAPKAAKVADPFRIDEFNHQAHAGASQQHSCLGCHDKLTAASASAAQLPRPSMNSCLTKCHDGQKAFLATGTKCTMCHKPSAPATPTATRRDLGFSHKDHAGRGVKITDCASCHQLLGDGTLTPPLANKDHMPCATSGCHQTEFTVKQPKICGVCHDAAVPWQKAIARHPQPIKLEWFEAMNHAAHIAKVATGKANATCESCHGDKLAGTPPQRGHAACAQCHTKGSRPAMTECTGCHMQNAPATLGAPSMWAVGQNFSHAKHAIDPRSRQTTSCLECHTQVITSKALPVTKPKMANCEGCHDGKSSFKTTGFECARCHAPKARQ